MTVCLRPEAQGDLDDAANWYERRRPGLGSEFLDEVLEDNDMVVLAVMHGRRDPAKWRART